MEQKEIDINWSNFKKQIESHLEISEKEAWLDNIYIIQLENNEIILGGLNHFLCNWVKENRAKILKKYIYENFYKNKKDFKLLFKIEKKKNFSLNLEYKFENFVNGDNTSIAYASAFSVANSLIENKISQYKSSFFTW